MRYGTDTSLTYLLYDMRLLLVLVQRSCCVFLFYALCILHLNNSVGERVSGLPEHRAAVHAADEKANGRGAAGDASYIKEGRAGAGAEAGLGGDHQKGGLAQRGVGRAAQPAARERLPAVGLVR